MARRPVKRDEDELLYLAKELAKATRGESHKDAFAGAKVERRPDGRTKGRRRSTRAEVDAALDRSGSTGIFGQASRRDPKSK